VILTSGYFDLERSTGMSEVSLRSRLIGAWQLVNFVMRDTATNAEERPWGEHLLGLILYTHDGYVSAQLQRPRRAPFVHDDPFNATAVEYAAAGSSCIAYSGRFFVDEAGQSVCHEMAVSFFPNWLGQRHTRKVKIAGEFLQLTVDRPNGEPKTATLTWRKAQPN
jgi:Lipocalin-like domain